LTVLAYRRKEFRLGFSGAVLLATAFGTGALAEFFKILFHRPHPPASLQLVTETGNGFPSSHAVAIVAVGAAVWYLWSIRPEDGWGGSWRAKARVERRTGGLGAGWGVGFCVPDSSRGLQETAPERKRGEHRRCERYAPRRAEQAGGGVGTFPFPDKAELRV
jgi:hypothetical protein